MKTYKININKKANGSTEIKSFENIHDAFSFFSELDVNELEETNGECDEYELLPYENDKMQDWTNEELNQIGWPENTWVIRDKISQ
ncbi:hypothetical protein [Chryseobacterium gambrini]|uniref:hypothetical protein n=1 Tax=Chryseobacterium gambrini TaxID=373672 RepID=UPI003D121C03